LPIEYFKRYIPFQGYSIMCRNETGEYQIAIMRWSDGLNKKVEEAIERDADKIVTALNDLNILLNKITEQAETGLSSLCVPNNYITKASFERIIKICEMEKNNDER
jgi:hypothetical protein